MVSELICIFAMSILFEHVPLNVFRYAEHTSKTAAYPKNLDMRRLSFINYDSVFLVQPCTDGQ